MKITVLLQHILQSTEVFYPNSSLIEGPTLLQPVIPLLDKDVQMNSSRTGIESLCLIKDCAMIVQGEWRYGFMYYKLQHQVELSVQFHALAILSLISIGYESGWASELVFRLLWKEKYLDLPVIELLISHSSLQLTD